MDIIKKLFFIFTAVTLACAGASAQSRVPIDYKADLAVPVEGIDSMVIAMTGNVSFHHNGTIVVCDSAVRYNEMVWECFRNVIINKDSTYIYGDWADYDGNKNIANVYAPLVKLVDGDVTMYSYDLQFNTLSSVGRYRRGGTISQKDNLMESIQAEYHTGTRTVYFVDSVAMQNDQYTIKSDSIGYNFNTEITTFYRKANIWDTDGDFLSADQGSHHRNEDMYIFTDNSYILTEKQQLWADSITYLKEQNISYLYNNIQIYDEEQNTYMHGDHGIYWGEQGDAILTRMPSVIAIDTTGEKPDSAYMRADSIFMYTIRLNASDSTDRASGAEASMEMPGEYHDHIQQSKEQLSPDMETAEKGGLAEGSEVVNESPGADKIPVKEDTESPETEKIITDSERPQQPDDGAPPEEGDIIAPEAAQETTAEENMPQVLTETSGDTSMGEEELLAADSTAKAGGIDEGVTTDKSKGQIRREFKAIRQLVRLGVPGYSMSMITRLDPSRYASDSTKIESTTEGDEETEIDDLYIDENAVEEVPVEPDSIQRVIKGYYNVKIFREDFQAACDSLIAFTIDSTMHMYSANPGADSVSVPVLWSENSQIFSDEIHVFSKNQELYRAEFEGFPMMIEQVSDSLYNQLTGKIMYAYFANNDIERLHVVGNAETYYYMMESGDEEPGGFFVVTSSEITFNFDTAGLYKISYMDAVDYKLHPMDKIPDTQPRLMPEFKWEGARRPMSKEDISKREIRPSQREESNLFVKPGFDITGLIDRRRREYAEQGIWRERYDIPKVTPADFDQGPLN